MAIYSTIIASRVEIEMYGLGTRKMAFSSRIWGYISNSKVDKQNQTY